MSKPLTLQDMILRLHEFWSAQDCIIWQPYNVQVGAGTMNPATFLRVLGPEPWNVAYVEPSVRPDDGRYGDNPNRMQYYYQYQVILKPDPGNPQELYLQSLEALGIDRRKHDIRFVEDNWESPALGAWGLGWEVWLDGQEITQFTYFQQAGGQTLNPISVEITYGIERILLPLQDREAVWDLTWVEGISYGDVLLRSEWEHSTYYFEVADVPGLSATYDTYEQEANRALEHEPPLVLPAYDYVLKMSHLFNVMDTRGAISVVERANYFRRMQRVAARVADAFVDQRYQMELPMLPADWEVDAETRAVSVAAPDAPDVALGTYPTKPAPFLLEIGTEELPAADLDSALAQLADLVPPLLDDARLEYESVQIAGTPRRLIALVEGLAPNQRAEVVERRGPPAKVARDADGNWTKAAEGFASSQGISTDDLEIVEIDGGEYVMARVTEESRPAAAVLGEELPNLIGAINFERSMRWDWSGVAFSRPIRWIVALHGAGVISFNYAQLYAGRTTRGTRPTGEPEIELSDTADYLKTMDAQGIIIDPAARREEVAEQIAVAAKKAGGQVKDDPDLLAEVTNLIEQPTAVLGSFSEAYLELPTPVLTTVMKKHQRYFAVVDEQGALMPYFIAVRNGDDQHLDTVTAGNEHVIRARFADARFFFEQDIKRTLADFLPDLKSISFQTKLGSYYDKTARLEGLAGRIGGALGLDDDGLDTTIRAARLAKADLATQLVTEMTSLQGVMGREYALRSGEAAAVADAIAEHYQPTSAGGALPQSSAGIALALADRIDSLVGLFAAGLEPTSSADPFALRRAAQGVVAILLGHGINLDLRTALGWSADAQPIPVSDEDKARVIDFIAGRLTGTLREDYAYDVVEAVLGEVAHDPYRAAVHAEQLTAWVSRDDWEPILDAYARTVRITRKQEETYPVDAALFEAPVEGALYDAVTAALAALGDDPDVDAMLTAFTPLVEPIDAFFAPADEGGVMVMADDPKLRQNRLGLLQQIAGMATGIADFSQLEGF